MILDYSDYVREQGSSGIVNYVSTETGKNLFNHEAFCPFCKKHIKEKVYYKEKKDYPEWLFGSFDQNETVVQCPTCGWWEYRYKNSSDAIIDGIRASDTEFCSAIVKKYDDASVEVPLNALREQLLRTPDIIYRIDAHKMEDLVRSVFSDFYPGCKVFSFGKTRDGGRDGVIVDDHGKQILLQVKRRTNADSTEGIGALRELMGVAILEDNLKGCVFVSTADHYSRDAKEYAEKIIEKRCVEVFDLYDCGEFLKLTNMTRDQLPNAWEGLIKLK